MFIMYKRVSHEGHFRIIIEETLTSTMVLLFLITYYLIISRLKH